MHYENCLSGTIRCEVNSQVTAVGLTFNSWKIGRFVRGLGWRNTPLIDGIMSETAMSAERSLKVVR